MRTQTPELDRRVADLEKLAEKLAKEHADEHASTRRELDRIKYALATRLTIDLTEQEA